MVLIASTPRAALATVKRLKLKPLQLTYEILAY